MAYTLPIELSNEIYTITNYVSASILAGAVDIILTLNGSTVTIPASTSFPIGNGLNNENDAIVDATGSTALLSIVKF